MPLDYQSEPFPQQVEGVRPLGASLRGVDGGRIHMVVMEPRAGRGKRPVVIYQHGGGQSMLTYFPEAAAMARAGAIAVIPDPPAAVAGRAGDMRAMSAEQVRDWYVRVVVAQRRVMDWLVARGDVDLSRVVYVGQSYGAVTAASTTRHGWSARIPSGGNGARNRARSSWRQAARCWPRWIRCATPGTRKAKALASPAGLRVYETDHAFADYRATLDRIRFVARQLRVRVKE